MIKKYIYRLASVQDIDSIRENEELFCADSSIPPEISEGINMFLSIGGQILLQEFESKITSAFWIIRSDKLVNCHSFLEFLPMSSPFRKILDQHIHQDFEPSSYFVHSWTSLTIHGKFFFRQVKRFVMDNYQNANLYGFVLVASEIAVRNYFRMGCKPIKCLPNLYYETDQHYLLHFSTRSEQKWCESKAVEDTCFVITRMELESVDQ